MKALILNSGMGSRMGEITSKHPKCMTEIDGQETILSRQLKLLQKTPIREVVITTGYYDDVLTDYCVSLNLPFEFTFIKNEKYQSTNYIYSIYCAREYLQDDILLLHGDLVFSERAVQKLMAYTQSCMAVCAAQALPQKDFKAVVSDGRIQKIGIEFFENAVAAQPLYKLNKKDWEVWLQSIVDFCDSGNVGCYAENAWNAVSDKSAIYPIDMEEDICCEIDNPEDLEWVKRRLNHER